MKIFNEFNNHKIEKFDITNDLNKLNLKEFNDILRYDYHESDKVNFLRKLGVFDYCLEFKKDEYKYENYIPSHLSNCWFNTVEKEFKVCINCYNRFWEVAKVLIMYKYRSDLKINFETFLRRIILWDHGKNFKLISELIDGWGN